MSDAAQTTKSGSGGVKRAVTNARDFPRKRLRKQTECEIDTISRADYVTLNGFQYAIPYKYIFTMHYKPRWDDQTLLAVFISEFPHAGSSYWEKEIEEKRVLANGVPATLSRRWVPGLRVEHAVHRHESAILAREITLLHSDDDLVAVCKPASLPVHPCGTYRRNSLQFCVAAQLGIRGLRVVHRLDKETSGVVIFARDKAAAARFNEQMKQHAFSKTYLAEVRGQFPFTESHNCALPLHWNAKAQRAESNAQLGKAALTTFRLLEYRRHSDTSLVEARPTTGRTHQIRAHLAALGHPIVDDKLYCGQSQPVTSAGAAVIPGAVGATINPAAAPLADDAVLDDIGDERATAAHTEGAALACRTCPRLGNARAADGADIAIRLHAARYARGPDWAVTAPPPPWAVMRLPDT